MDAPLGGGARRPDRAARGRGRVFEAELREAEFELA
jgi:hypothetical protein